MLDARSQREDRRYYPPPVTALAYLPHRDRAIVSHGPIVELQDAQGSQIIELDSEVLALATASPHTVVAAAELGIVVLEVP